MIWCKASTMHSGMGDIDDVSRIPEPQIVVIGLVLSREGKHREALDNYLKREAITTL